MSEESTRHHKNGKHKTRARKRRKSRKSQETCCFGLCGLESDSDACYLYAFDFDRTILDQSSDLALAAIFRGPIPQGLVRMPDGSNWEQYMDGIFRVIGDQGITFDMIAKQLVLLEATEGMHHLLHKISMARNHVHSNSRLIVISDSNALFIDTYLSSLKPPVVPDATLANHAKVLDEGRLKMTPFDNQETCPFCPMNICKGKALTEYIQREGPFERVFYVGDGENDFCAGLRLTHNDVLFVRKDHELDNLLKRGLGIWKRQRLSIKANIVFWTTAKEIEHEMAF